MFLTESSGPAQATLTCTSAAPIPTVRTRSITRGGVPCTSDSAATATQRSCRLPREIRSTSEMPTMTDGWRSRFMAPVYALVISFGFAFFLGFALDDLTRVRFVTVEQSGSSELPQEFEKFQVRVKPVDNESQPPRKVGRSGEFTLSTPDKEIQICTTLPTGWSAKGAKVDTVTKESCSVSHPARGKDVDITLKGP